MGAFSKDVLLHKGEYSGNFMEPVTAEIHSVKDFRREYSINLVEPATVEIHSVRSFYVNAQINCACSDFKYRQSTFLR